MNAGQMIEDVRLALGDRTPIDFYGRVGAMLVEVETIMEKVKSYA
jgi:2-oxoglutarate ferredoxin oxidoreductase subunit alpha